MGDEAKVKRGGRPRSELVDAAAREVIRLGVTATEAAARYGCSQTGVSKRVRQMRAAS